MTLNSWNGALTPNGALIANSDASGGSSVVLTNGQLLIGSTGNAPVGATLTAGSNISLTNAAGAITINSTTGAWEIVQTQSANNTASITFTNLGFNLNGNYFLYINGYRPATNTTQLLLTFSLDNGSTFKSSGYFSGLNYSAYNTATLTNANSTSNIVLGTAIASSSAFHACVWISSIGASRIGVHGTAVWGVSGASNFGTIGGNWGNGTVNAIRLESSSGNMTIGGFTLYRALTS
jgi:hypothetical protein